QRRRWLGAHPVHPERPRPAGVEHEHAAYRSATAVRGRADPDRLPAVDTLGGHGSLAAPAPSEHAALQHAELVCLDQQRRDGALARHRTYTPRRGGHDRADGPRRPRLANPARRSDKRPCVEYSPHQPGALPAQPLQRLQQRATDPATERPWSMSDATTTRPPAKWRRPLRWLLRGLAGSVAVPLLAL